MKIIFSVPIEIKLADDLPDPKSGDPLFERMRLSASEAVRAALDYAHETGFAHDMECISTIEIGTVIELENSPS